MKQVLINAFWMACEYTFYTVFVVCCLYVIAILAISNADISDYIMKYLRGAWYGVE